MRCAILSDIHANYPALAEVEKDAARLGVNQFWSLGDVIDYGPFPLQSIEFLRRRVNRNAWIIGDHELGLVGDHLPPEWFSEDALRAIKDTRSLLAEDPPVLDWCTTSFKYRKSRLRRFVAAGGGYYLLTHGTLMNAETEYLYPWQDLNLRGELLRLRDAYVKAGHRNARQRLFSGNSHWPFLAQGQIHRIGRGRQDRPKIRHVYTTLSTEFASGKQELIALKNLLGDRVHDLAEYQARPIPLGNGPVIINPGSVGQPRDGSPDASYAILDTRAQTMHFRRVPYERWRTQKEMRLREFPSELIKALEGGG